MCIKNRRVPPSVLIFLGEAFNIIITIVHINSQHFNVKCCGFMSMRGESSPNMNTIDILHFPG